MPWGTVGNRLRKAGLSPSIVTEPTARFHRDIDSTPPATTRSWWPLPTPIAATVIACWAEPQNRLIVRPGTVSGQPASRVASRPTVVVIAAQDPVAGDDVLNVGRIEPHPGGQGGEALGEQLLWMDLVQGAVWAAAASVAYGPHRRSRRRPRSGRLLEGRPWAGVGEQLAHDRPDLFGRLHRLSGRSTVPAFGDPEHTPGRLDDLAGHIRRVGRGQPGGHRGDPAGRKALPNLV